MDDTRSGLSEAAYWVPHLQHGWSAAVVVGQSCAIRSTSTRTSIAKTASPVDKSHTVQLKVLRNPFYLLTDLSSIESVKSAIDGCAEVDAELLEVSALDLHSIDPSHLVDVHDICYMNFMHEAPILHLLHRRFMKSSPQPQIYTYTGSVLISLNPYTAIEKLYDNPIQHLDLSEGLNTSQTTIYRATKNDHSTATWQALHRPHAYQVGNRALNALIDIYYSRQPSTHIGNAARLPSVCHDGRDNRCVSDNQNPSALVNQTIIINGECGAGKTMCARYIIDFLLSSDAVVERINEQGGFSREFGLPAAGEAEALLASEVLPLSTPETTSTIDGEIRRVQVAVALKPILSMSSLLLESFGNAKTIRNDNSSRFGMYTKLYYGDLWSTVVNKEKRVSKIQRRTSMYGRGSSSAYLPLIQEAEIETFLLEKSRIVSVGPGERNYHIFYYLVNGLRYADPHLSVLLSLDRSPDEFQILRTTAESVENVLVPEKAHLVAESVQFETVLTALKDTLHCTAKELKDLWSILAAILHIGNLKVEEQEADDSNDSTLRRLYCHTMDIGCIATLLGSEERALTVALTTQRLRVARRGSVHMKQLSPLDVVHNAWGLMKYLYHCLFHWLVKRINETQRAFCQADSSQDDPYFIGVFDIFGFEILNHNSLEQLCINLTNERLQKQFYEYIFETEQSLYHREGLQWDNISFKDNQPVIDLICSTKNPKGLLPILEERALLNRAPDDAALLAQYQVAHEACSTSPQRSGAMPVLTTSFSRSKFGDGFVIQHFAGDVYYNVAGFILKNNDSLQPDLIEMLSQTSNSLLQAILPSNKINNLPFSTHSSLDNTTDAVKNGTNCVGKSGGQPTVSQQFRAQLDTLMAAIRETTPHYIACISSNREQQSMTFDAPTVLQQLRYSGVIDVAHIKKEGYPIHLKFREFYQNYEIFTFEKSMAHLKGLGNSSENEMRRSCAEIASRILSLNDYQIGKSLIFLHAEAWEKLEYRFRELLGKLVSRFQALCRGRICRMQVSSSSALRNRANAGPQKYNDSVADRNQTPSEEKDSSVTENKDTITDGATVAFIDSNAVHASVASVAPYAPLTDSKFEHHVAQFPVRQQMWKSANTRVSTTMGVATADDPQFDMAEFVRRSSSTKNPSSVNASHQEATSPNRRPDSTSEPLLRDGTNRKFSLWDLLCGYSRN